VRADVTYAGDPGGIGRDRRVRPASPIRPGMHDEDWIPIAAGAGWIVITRDGAMIRKPVEREAITSAGARHVALDPEKKQLNVWQELEVVVTQWRSIERLLDEPGPWVYFATRSRLRKVC